MPATDELSLAEQVSLRSQCTTILMAQQSVLRVHADRRQRVELSVGDGTRALSSAEVRVIVAALTAR